METIDASNYFECTAAVFKPVEQPDREPDYVSASGSAYWHEDGGIVRRSNHWGYSIASCHWWLRGLTDEMFRTLSLEGDEYREVCGFARFDDFVFVGHGDEYYKFFDGETLR